MANVATAIAPTKVVTGKVRFSYAHVFTPKALGEGQEPKYSVSILVPKSDIETVAKIKASIKTAIDQGKANSWGGVVPANLKIPLRDGDIEKPEDRTYAGHYFINASSKQQPGLIDAFNNKIIDSNEFYSGCYGRVSVNFYAFNKNGNRGIAAGLNNIQKTSDGEHLGGRARAEDEFGVYQAEPSSVTGGGILD
jgi:hypothetical protein